MQNFGQLLLVVTFLVTITTALTAIAGALTRSVRLTTAARYGVYAVATLNIALAIILTHGFLTHDYSNKYIAAYSDRTMPTMYLLASFWGGEKGALLFWTTTLSIFSAIAVHTNRERNAIYMAWVSAILMFAIGFFGMLMVFESSPFETWVASAGPRDGKGLNPLLQNPTMVFHPPSLLTGYITFTIPFAFAVGAMITGKLDTQWITDSRRWTIVSWMFLSIGLLLGCLWAYEELGWGFYWMWDPVENAGFIPWLTGTAFLHSVMIQERRGMLRRWNMVLVCLTFFLTIFGTFLTRSQLIDSIHAFADSQLAYHFLWYMGVLIVLSLILLIWRWKDLAPDDKIDSFASRESMFVLNNFILVGSAFVVLWGTLFPKLSSLEPVQAAHNGFASFWNATGGHVFGQMDEMNQAINLGEPWFNEVMAPVGLALLLLMGIGPLVSWRRATVKNFETNLKVPLFGAMILTAIGTAIGVYFEVVNIAARFELSMGDAYSNWSGSLALVDLYTVLAWWLCLFVGWTIGREFHRGARIRQRKFGGAWVPAVISLIFKNPRRYGGYIIHLGVVLMFVAFTGKVFKEQLPERIMNIGETMTTEKGDYSLTFSASEQAWSKEGGYAMTRATLSVVEDDETVAPEQVDDLVAWLGEAYPGTLHVSTELASPKMRVIFKDAATRDRVLTDWYLAKSFANEFRPLPGPRRASQDYTLTDTDLLKVQPMLAMTKLRGARDMLDGNEVLGITKAAITPGSTRMSLTFSDAAHRKAFMARVKETTIPEDLLLAHHDTNSGGVDFVSALTGSRLYPEVRFYAKHSTPTTETAITSKAYEDLYVAMRPAMGKPFINLLTVVFPLVAFLWLGGVLVLSGGVVALTPRWLSQTIISMMRPRRRKRGSGGDDDDDPEPAAGGESGGEDGLPSAVAGGANVAALALILSAAALLVTGSAPAVHAHDGDGHTELDPPPLASPSGDRYEDLLGALTCTCLQDGKETNELFSLADPRCGCALSTRDRGIVTELYDRTSEADRASGKAVMTVLLDLLEVNQAWSERLRYREADYDAILDTTKTTCSGERGLVLARSQIQCSVRAKWLPIFRVMLTAGYDGETIYRFYVSENNATEAPATPWTLDDLRANPDAAASWAFPAMVIAGLLTLFAVSVFRKVRRRHAKARSEAPSPAMPGQAGAPAIAASGGELGAQDRRRLLDELDRYDV